MKKPNKKLFRKKNFFGQKLKFLAHSEGCNRLKIISYSISATMGQNSVECKTKITKNSQFIVKITKNFHYGPISHKMPYRIFSNIPFWKAPRVPSNIPPMVYQNHLVCKTRPKKGVCSPY
jgi:hypothetical protein